jgi:hypothetical protein
MTSKQKCYNDNVQSVVVASDKILTDLVNNHLPSAFTIPTAIGYVPDLYYPIPNDGSSPSATISGPIVRIKTHKTCLVTITARIAGTIGQYIAGGISFSVRRSGESEPYIQASDATTLSVTNFYFGQPTPTPIDPYHPNFANLQGSRSSATYFVDNLKPGKNVFQCMYNGFGGAYLINGVNLTVQAFYDQKH